jgi:hypothetical protein
MKGKLICARLVLMMMPTLTEFTWESVSTEAFSPEQTAFQSKEFSEESKPPAKAPASLLRFGTLF